MTYAFSPKTLGTRWGCSAETVRQMVKRGELTSFRAGPKLIRIPAQEVERFECQNTGLLSTEASSASPTPAPLAGYASRLARMTGVGPNLLVVRFGAPVPNPLQEG